MILSVDSLDMSIGSFHQFSEIPAVQDFFSSPDEKSRAVLVLVSSQSEWEKPLEAWLSSLIPGGARIQREPSGRPFVRCAPEFFLSVSTQPGMVAVALAGQPVGIDVERLSRRVSFIEIARRYFTEKETDWILQCTEEQERRRRFFVLWTAREASVKLDGSGIAGGFGHWHPTEWNDSPPSCCVASLHGKKIFLTNFEIAEGVTAALAAFSPPGTFTKIHGFQSAICFAARRPERNAPCAVAK